MGVLKQVEMIVSELTLDKITLEDVLLKRIGRPWHRRRAVAYLCAGYNGGKRHLCKVERLPRQMQRYHHPQAALCPQFVVCPSSFGKEE